MDRFVAQRSMLFGGLGRGAKGMGDLFSQVENTRRKNVRRKRGFAIKIVL
jgi:hypothetical protein